MFNVIFFSYTSQRWVTVKSCRKLENASALARQLYVDSGRSHYIQLKDGTVLDAYKKEVTKDINTL